MASKRINGTSSSKDYGFYIDLKELSQSINDNTTRLEYKLYVKNNGYSFQSGGWNIRVNINGKYVVNETKADQTIDSYTGLSVWDTKLIRSGTTTIPHNNDGSKKINVSATIYKNDGYAPFDPGKCSLSGSMSLTKIDRLATFTSYPTIINDETPIHVEFDNPANFGVALSLQIENADGSSTGIWYHNVEFEPDPNMTNPLEWNIIEDDTQKQRVYEILRNTPNGQGKAKLSLYTFNGDEYIGFVRTPYLPITITEVRPEIDLYFEETNEIVKQLITDRETLLNNVSVLKVTAEVYTYKGANTKFVKINGKTISTDPYETILPIRDISGDMFVVEGYSKDTRDVESDLKTIPCHVIDYLPVKINKCQFFRVNPTSDVIKLNADITYFQTQIGNTTNTIELKIKDVNNNVEQVIPSSDYTIDNETHKIIFTAYTIPFTLDYRTQNSYVLTATDIIGTSEEKRRVTKGIGVVELGDSEVQVNGDILIADANRENIRNLKDIIPKVNITQTENDKDTYSCNYINSIVESGSNFKGDYIKFSDGTMICLMTKGYTFDCSRSWGSMYYGKNEDVIEFPQEFITIPRTYTNLITTTGSSCWEINYSKPIITTSTYQNYAIARPTSSSSVETVFYIFAIGRWKE